MTLTTGMFIEKAKAKHGDAYDYSLVDYKTTSIKVKIICKTCGNIWMQIPRSHLRGLRCPKCIHAKAMDAKRTHGLTGTRIYKTWSNMLTRCNNPKAKDYYRYGGRGIKVQESFYVFQNFYDYVKTLKNFENHNQLTIDRIENDGDYVEGNLQWITMREQLGKQGIRSNNKSGYKGVSLLKNRKSRPYLATILHDGVKHSLGYFDKPEPAALAYNQFIIDNGLQNIRAMNNISLEKVITEKLGLL